MLNRLIGDVSPARDLKGGLDASARSLRRIAHRVANSGSRGQEGGFSKALDDAREAGRVDLEAEMVTLADEQIRYEVSTRLLRKVYQQAHRAVREA